MEYESQYFSVYNIGEWTKKRPLEKKSKNDPAEEKETLEEEQIKQIQGNSGFHQRRANEKKPNISDRSYSDWSC